MSGKKQCKHCRNGWFRGTDVECVNGVLIDIDIAYEGWQTDVEYPAAPCIAKSGKWPIGDRGCQVRLEEWAARGTDHADRGVSKPDLGRIGNLAEALRCAGRAVANDMVLTPGGDAYEYRGSTTNVEWLIKALNDLEHFQAGWR